MTGVKDVELMASGSGSPPKPLPAKAKRQTFRAAVKQLGERLEEKRRELEKAEWNLQAATSAHATLQAEVFALTDAYNLVKPPPRAKRGKA